MREKRQCRQFAPCCCSCLGAVAPSEQPAKQTSQPGQDSSEQPDDTSQQAADGTTKTPQQTHRL